MSVIAISNGLYSNTESRIKMLSEKLKLSVIEDDDILKETSERANIKLSTLQKVFHSKQLAFNDFTHEKEHCIAAIKETLSDYIMEGNFIFRGFVGHLIPEDVTHVLKVLMIKDKPARIKHAVENLKISEKDAKYNVKEADKVAILWTNGIKGIKVWESELYDIVIPTDKVGEEESVEMILEYVKKVSDIPADKIEKEKIDFNIEARSEVLLSKISKGLSASSENGNVTVTINRKVFMLSKLQQKIISTVEELDGVKSVTTKIGINFYKGQITRNYDFETPMNVLLVDDEKDFVQTLSSRLQLRQINSKIAYSGQEALDYAESIDTEVMVLDLKMPGIDGIEVLRKIKATKPNIEVIILTGHGSDEDRKTCMELGAFAYLRKPADIDKLTETMKKAYEKVNSKAAVK